jgi:Replication-relaxation
MGEFANDSLLHTEGEMSRDAYLTEARVAELAERLTPTDQAIVATLDRVRPASGSQLERLHFTGNGTTETVSRRARRTLERLVTLRVLARLDRRVGGARAGSAGYLYALDIAGQRIASACGPAGGARIRRPWTPGNAFVVHQLAVTELYVRLREAEREQTCELVAFDAEPSCWRASPGSAAVASGSSPTPSFG